MALASPRRGTTVLRCRAGHHFSTPGTSKGREDHALSQCPLKVEHLSRLAQCCHLVTAHATTVGRAQRLHKRGLRVLCNTRPIPLPVNDSGPHRRGLSQVLLQSGGFWHSG